MSQPISPVVQWQADEGRGGWLADGGGMLLVTHDAEQAARLSHRRLRVAAAIAERIKLLDIAEFDSRLLGNPASEAAFERAVLERRERARRQTVLRSISFFAHGKNHRLVVEHGNDGGIEADFNFSLTDSWSLMLGYSHDLQECHWYRQEESPHNL